MAVKKSFELHRQGRRVGIFTDLQVEDLARTGQLRPDDELVSLGTTNRRRVAEIGGLLESRPTPIVAGDGRREAAPPPVLSGGAVDERAASWTTAVEQPAAAAPDAPANPSDEVPISLRRGRSGYRRRRTRRGDQTALTLITLGLALVALLVGVAVVVVNQR